MKFSTVLAAMLLTASGSAAFAHHSGAMFDDQKTIALQGVISEFNWTNPHSSIKIVVDGVVWAVEMNSPGNLVREGWKRTSLKAGDKAALLVHPLRDGKPGAIYLAVKLADGTTIAPGGSGYDKQLEAELASKP